MTFVKSVLIDLLAITMGAATVGVILILINWWDSPSDAPDVSSTTAVLEQSPILNCERLRVMYDRAYLDALPEDRQDVDWSGIDKVFYEKFSHCLYPPKPPQKDTQ